MSMGQPTNLVRDGEVESYEDPPDSRPVHSAVGIEPPADLLIEEILTIDAHDRDKITATADVHDPEHEGGQATQISSPFDAADAAEAVVVADLERRSWRNRHPTARIAIGLAVYPLLFLLVAIGGSPAYWAFAAVAAIAVPLSFALSRQRRDRIERARGDAWWAEYEHSKHVPLDPGSAL
jgi:hypothetical protein